MAQAEKAKQNATPPANVIDVTAQFTATPPTPAKAETNNTPPTPPVDVSNNMDTSNKGNDDGTIYQNE